MTTGQIGNTSGGYTYQLLGTPLVQFTGGPYTVPDPGIYPIELHWHGNTNNGGSSSARLYMWLDNGSGTLPSTAVYSQSTTFTINTTSQWWPTSSIALTYRNNATGYSDGYIPGGTKIWLGIYDGTSHFDNTCIAPGSGHAIIGQGNDGTPAGTGAWGFHTGGDVSTHVGYLAAYSVFNYAVPVVQSASTTNIYPGESITLTGYAFNSATSVNFNGANASSFTINSNTSITVTVPNGIAGGTVTVTNAYGTGAGIAYTLVGGYVFRSSTWTPSQGTFVYRGGVWTPASGVFVYRGGVWTPSQ